MKICIITHVEHIKTGKEYYGYAPYVREINIWLKYVDEVVIVAPKTEERINPIYLSYKHDNVSFIEVPAFSLIGVREVFKTIFFLPKICVTLFRAMWEAEYIHLRCPGNMGLIGAIVQMFFPGKPKTAKYAGNWDPKAKQPLSYRIQKWILSNTFLTRNMQVLVYGEWEGSTKNIKPFFTASYKESDKTDVSLREIASPSREKFSGPQQVQNDRGGSPCVGMTGRSFDEIRMTRDSSFVGMTEKTRDDKDYFANSSKAGGSSVEMTRDVEAPIRFLFVGTLSEGKRPLYAVGLVEQLLNLGYSANLDLYGEGKERPILETYIKEKGLGKNIVLHGNQTATAIQRAYQESHFLILPSKSEGWPKVVAEAMFWGCVPVATAVSCVPYMLDHGGRGIVLELDTDVDVKQLEDCIEDADVYSQKAKKAVHWSRKYTLDYFESEIQKLLEIPPASE